MESFRPHGVQAEQIDHHLCSSISLGDMLHISVHTTTCFLVLGLQREEPTTTSSSNVPHLAPVVLRTATAGIGSSNERLLCEPLHQHLTSVNSQDYRERRCIARALLLRRSKTLSYLFGPTDALLAACSVLSLFYRAGVVSSLSFPTLFLGQWPKTGAPGSFLARNGWAEL